MISTVVAHSLLIGSSMVDTSSPVLLVSGTGVTKTLTCSPTPRLLHFQCAWGGSTLGLGVGAVDVSVSWMGVGFCVLYIGGVTGSPRADLEKEEAASIV